MVQQIKFMTCKAYKVNYHRFSLWSQEIILYQDSIFTYVCSDSEQQFNNGLVNSLVQNSRQAHTQPTEHMM